ncbi:MAG: magnesium/cobalt transporter CorA [Desulfobacterales bacterium]|nr:magnesium/cobalt transporter CorA [Desulfobacterales bacterium]
MSRFLKKVAKKTGAAPGTLIHVGERRIDRAKISLMSYNQEDFHFVEYESIDELPDIGTDIGPDIEPSIESGTGKTVWLNIDGVHDVALIEAIGNRYTIHPLTLEDILHTGQRPKAELFDDYMYIVLRMIQYDEADGQLRSEQISFILFPGLLISFQESIDDDVFSGVRERIQKGKGKIRGLSCDYLAYALIDAIVDHYFVILEKFGQDVESLEEELTDSPSRHSMQRIHELRHEFIYLRKQIWPLREVVNNLTKGDGGFFQEKARFFLRDVYDHTIQVIDTIESYRDILSGYMDLYLSIASNRMNEVMKVLTIISTIFIPITFIAGVYGMNFKHMPELDWRWGYFGAWGLMGISAFAMIFYFKKKDWW